MAGRNIFTIFSLSVLLSLPLANPFCHGSTTSVTTIPSRKRFEQLQQLPAVAEGALLESPSTINRNIPSRLFFRYVSPLIQKASRTEEGGDRLDASDACDVPPHRQMEAAVSGLSQIYNEIENKSPADSTSASWRLTKALLKHNKRIFLRTGLLRLVNTIIQAFPAILVKRLLTSLEEGSPDSVRWAVYLVLVLTGKMLVENQYFDQVVQQSTAVRGSLAGLLFDKSLRLPNGGSHVIVQRNKGATNNNTLGTGGVLNLMQTDTAILESTAQQIHTIWDGPLQIAIYTYLLVQTLGNSVFWGISVLVATIPLNSVLLRLLHRLAQRENECRDRRTQRTAESMTYMKLLKLVGWEQRFEDSIAEHRQEELTRHAQRGIVRALSSAISNAVPALVLVVTLTMYTKTAPVMKASTIFTAISLFNQLRFPLFFYPMLIDSLANGRNAMDRLAAFLTATELMPYVSHEVSNADGGHVYMDSGNFIWPTNKNGTVVPALANAHVEVEPGKVVAVVGSVGSGKTALIKALLGELTPVPSHIVNAKLSDNTVALHPTVRMQGTVAYCSQEAWLPKGSLRDAVVFGRDYDETRYRQAIYDAGLDRDITEGDFQLSGGNQQGLLSHSTDVGEGGSNLSGGQRARVALARALYSDAKVFLLDDCLAALDASVGATVFNRVTSRLRARKAAVVLVTNDPSLPRRCEQVYLMGKVSTSSSPCSTIIDTGTYDELIARGHDLKTNSTLTQTMGAVQAVPGNATSVSDSRKNFAGHSPRTNDTAIPEGVKKSIKVCGQTFHAPPNTTDTRAWCHADPECQAAMENCPDFVTDHIQGKSATWPDKEESGCIEVHTVVQYASNSTLSSPSETTNTEPGAKEHDSVSSQGATRLESVDDVMSTGAVPISTYISYLKAVRKPILVAAMLASFLMVNGAQFFQQYTVAKWTELSTTSGMAEALGAKYMKSLVNAAGVVSVFLWVRSYLLMRVGVRASSFLHTRMLKSVFAAPMSFFDATPSGQILSRFGKEMETVDRGVPDSIGSVLFCFLQIFMSIGALSAIITPAMMLPLTMVSYFYVRTMSRFRPAARDMKRAETKTRSPIYTQFGETLRGVETIRSVPGAKRKWSSMHRSLADKNLAVFYTVKSFDRWLATRLETLGNTVVLTAAMASVFLTRAGRMQAGSAGWGLTQALAVTGLLTWAVRCLTDLESSMLSVMRVKEMTDLDSSDVVLPEGERSTYIIPVEPRKPGEALKPLLPAQSNVTAALAPSSSCALQNNGWPWKGNVEFRDVSMRYNAASPLVLKDVSVTIPAGTTLGVVGRTGSGKSSLLLTLFRLNEIEGKGAIEIDGVDIRSVDLATLRSSLAIIPQDPVLFAGTIAYNLDASGKASEEEMWSVLETASPSLAAQFKRSEGLKSPITEGGKNLSLGQRQLICLARALLRKSKVLVLDEATSSVDSKTDRQVQQTIRREFVEKGVTVITVAHRLETVLGYNKIAVLGAGRVLEYGSPEELLRRSQGELRRLVDADRRNKQKGAVQQPPVTLEATS